MKQQLSKEVKTQILILNQIFEIEKKVEKLQEKNSIKRNIDKLKSIYEEFNDEVSFIVENPMGQKCDETRTDLEMMIAGESPDNLVVVDVIKPIIRIKQNNIPLIIQRGVVVVESKNNNHSQNEDVKKKFQTTLQKIGKTQKENIKKSTKKLKWQEKKRIIKKNQRRK